MYYLVDEVIHKIQILSFKNEKGRYMFIYHLILGHHTSLKFGYISYGLIASSTMVKMIISRTYLFMWFFDFNTIHLILRYIQRN